MTEGKQVVRRASSAQAAACGWTLFLTACFVLTSAVAPAAPSLWRHLAGGRLIAQSGLPTSDPFAILGTGRPWANTEWLFDLAVYLVSVAGGPTGLFLAKLVLASVLAFAVLPPRRGPGASLVLPVLVAIPVMREGLALAPTLVSLLALAAFTNVLSRWRQWTLHGLAVRLAGIQVMWANTSSHFTLAPLLLACAWAGSSLDRWFDRTHSHHQPPHGRFGLGLVILAIGSLANPFPLSGIRASLWETFASFMIPADGQRVVPGLFPIWSEGVAEDCRAWFVILLVSAAGVALIVLPRRPPSAQFQWLLPSCLVAVLGASDFRLAPLAALWLACVIRVGLVRIFSPTTTGLVPVESCLEDQKTPEKMPPSGCQTRLHAGKPRGEHGSTWLRWTYRVACGVALAWMGLVLAFQSPSVGLQIRRQLLGGDPVQSRIQWLAQGVLSADDAGASVLALDLRDSAWPAWGDPRLKIVIDDRCALFGRDYALYANLCTDIRDDRHNTYRKTDGSLGGWRSAYNLLRFAWIISRSDDLETNTRLNSSNFWGPVYWDTEVVIFGKKASPLAKSAAARLTASEQDLATRGQGTHDIVNDATRPGFQERASPDDLRILGEMPREYSAGELLGAAKLMYALDCPHLAVHLLACIDYSRWGAEGNALMERCQRVLHRHGTLAVPAHSAHAGERSADTP